MKAAKITLIIISLAALICAIKQDDRFSLPTTLPFLDDQTVDMYTAAKVIMIVIFLWGLGRLGRLTKRSRDYGNYNQAYYTRYVDSKDDRTDVRP